MYNIDYTPRYTEITIAGDPIISPLKKKAKGDPSSDITQSRQKTERVENLKKMLPAPTFVRM